MPKHNGICCQKAKKKKNIMVFCIFLVVMSILYFDLCFCIAFFRLMCILLFNVISVCVCVVYCFLIMFIGLSLNKTSLRPIKDIGREE